ncbi:MAG TPA: SRPBCC family protein [Trebonia sp.]|jgi:hypothetical protein|nr:SRPBCC family protein [Trebonia sp.]
MPPTRIEVTRLITASPAVIFELLCDPAGHVAIDSSGMLQSAEGARVRSAGDSFVVHMDRESLNDRPLGKYDVTVTITRLEPGARIEWMISGAGRPALGHVYGYELLLDTTGTRVTSYYDWSQVAAGPERDAAFPVVPELALRATLGILARTVEVASRA